MTHTFAVSFDYRCPFARNAHEAVVAGLAAGRDWDVTFVAFSLDQVHVEDGAPAVWDRAPDARGSGVLALQWGLAVRDEFPEQFVDWHVAAFAARHDHGRRIADPDVLRDVASSVGLDAGSVEAVVATGGPLRTLAAEHTDSVRRHAMFGVPTFVVGEQAAFIRLMDRGRADDVDRVLELLASPSLNELKHTRIPR
jgi:protein-disulfide isomerase-like protein with CxxC motif